MEINWKRNTALFVAGQTLSLFGTLLVQYAILWHITLKTQSGAMMTVFTIAGFLPMFFISPFAGVWADRFNRKQIINIADGSIALVSLFVAVSLLFGFDDYIGILLICAVVRSIGQGAQMPAVSALIPQIVPQESLTKVNGILSSIQAGTTLAAPMVSGALMTFAPLEILFFVDVVTAGLAISILFFFVKVPAMEKQGEGKKRIEYFNDQKEGFNYVKEHGYILRLVLLSSVFMICASPSALLTPLQVIRDFGSEVWRLTAIEVTFSVGMMFGGILISAWGGFKNRVYTMALAVALYGLGVIGLGLVNNFFVYIGIFAGIGIAMPLFNTPIVVLFQSTVDSAFMGRVFSVFGMASSVLMPLSMVVFGPLSDTIAIDMLLIGTGIVIALLGIPFVASKTLREAGRSHS
jgi:MFS transporter, DHA3 family, macrolide efflux protein